jgi:peptidoglycan/LPS O-acetylase OafA/YrhL
MVIDDASPVPAKVELAGLQSGMNPDAAIAIALAVALLLSTALTRLVEQPVMGLARARYRQRQLAGSTVGTAPER